MKHANGSLAKHTQNGNSETRKRKLRDVEQMEAMMTDIVDEKDGTPVKAANKGKRLRPNDFSPK